jgi:hypothetical protein
MEFGTILWLFRYAIIDASGYICWQIIVRNCQGNLVIPRIGRWPYQFMLALTTIPRLPCMVDSVIQAAVVIRAINVSLPNYG